MALFLPFFNGIDSRNREKKISLNFLHPKVVQSMFTKFEQPGQCYYGSDLFGIVSMIAEGLEKFAFLFDFIYPFFLKSYFSLT